MFKFVGITWSENLRFVDRMWREYTQQLVANSGLCNENFHSYRIGNSVRKRPCIIRCLLLQLFFHKQKSKLMTAVHLVFFWIGWQRKSLSVAVESYTKFELKYQLCDMQFFFFYDMLEVCACPHVFRHSSRRAFEGLYATQTRTTLRRRLLDRVGSHTPTPHFLPWNSCLRTIMERLASRG